MKRCLLMIVGRTPIILRRNTVEVNVCLGGME
jgi:hypothetical protein